MLHHLQSALNGKKEIRKIANKFEIYVSGIRIGKTASLQNAEDFYNSFIRKLQNDIRKFEIESKLRKLRSLVWENDGDEISTEIDRLKIEYTTLFNSYLSPSFMIQFKN